MGKPDTPHAQGTVQRSISLFWRTFLLLGLLLLGSVVAWFQTFRTLEEEPRALQSARQLASLVNLTRAALVHADAIARVSLVKTLVDEENVRIAVREPNDTHLPYNQTTHNRRVSEVLAERLGRDTLVAREVNGFAGLWIGFNIGEETYWLLADPERVDAIGGVTWLVWLGIAGSLSLLGAAAIARLINHPLKRLSWAAARVREGDFQASRLDESVPTTEIRAVNVGFNRMAERLAKAEADRALMLAGISHDLRTPLARLRLETEMSVPEPNTRELMAADIEQVNTIIDKFMDYARNRQARLEPVDLNEAVASSLQPLANLPDWAVDLQLLPGLKVWGDAVELRRVLTNLLENAARYGRDAQGQTRVTLQATAAGKWVQLVLRDHGPGVASDVLPRLTEPFFRGDVARTSASGSGLGLAIVQKTVERMGGEFHLSTPPEGGLQATLRLRKA